MAAVTYDGSNIVLNLRYSDNTHTYTTGYSTYTIVGDSAWGCFQGLRYNDWLNGTFGYTAIYYGVLSISDIFKIFHNFFKFKERYSGGDGNKLSPGIKINSVFMGTGVVQHDEQVIIKYLLRKFLLLEEFFLVSIWKISASILYIYAKN